MSTSGRKRLTEVISNAHNEHLENMGGGVGSPRIKGGSLREPKVVGNGEIEKKIAIFCNISQQEKAGNRESKMYGKREVVVVVDAVDVVVVVDAAVFVVVDAVVVVVVVVILKCVVTDITQTPLGLALFRFSLDELSRERSTTL